MTMTSLSNSAGLRIVSWQIQAPDIIDYDPTGEYAEYIGRRVVYLMQNKGKNTWNIETGILTEEDVLDDYNKVHNIEDYQKARKFAEDFAIDNDAIYVISLPESEYLGKIERHRRGASLKFASDDPSFDDYDINDKDRKRNDFFLYDKNDTVDALDDQQSYHTDKMYLEDTQRTQKERDAFDWTGRENLQFGFGSLKFAWRVQEENYHHKYEDEEGNVFYENEQGESHRLNGPAMEWIKGDKLWFINDKLHRLDGPAVIRDQGTYQAWWVKGELVGDSDYGFNQEDFENYKSEHNIISSLKFSDEYFDSSPAESNPIEESKLVNPIDDKHLRRTNPKRFDKRHDWYQETDSDISNRYDNAIQGDASLKFAWQVQDELIVYRIPETEDIQEFFALGVITSTNEDGTYNVERVDEISTTSGAEHSIELFDVIVADELQLEGLYGVEREHDEWRDDDIIDIVSEDNIVKKYELPEVLRLRFSWQMQEPLYALYDTETGELYLSGDEDIIKSYWWNILKFSNDVGGHVLDLSVPGNYVIYENETGEIKFMAPTIEGLKDKWWAYFKYHEEEGGYGLTTTDKFNEEINTPPPHRASKIAWQVQPDEKEIPDYGDIDPKKLFLEHMFRDKETNSMWRLTGIYHNRTYGRNEVEVDLRNVSNYILHRQKIPYEWFQQNFMMRELDTPTTQESSSNSAGLKIFSWAKAG